MNNRGMPVFDTHKAVKALCNSGFTDSQAEAVVEQINGAVNENVATKQDLRDNVADLRAAIDLLATKEELRSAVAPLATKEDLGALATKEELGALATKEELGALATKEELGALATKEELRSAVAPLATKEELRSAVAPLATKGELRSAVAPLATREELRMLATKEELRALATKAELAQLEVRLMAKIDDLTGKMLRYMGGGIALVVALIKANRYRDSERMPRFVYGDLMRDITTALLGETVFLFNEQWVVKGAEQGMKFAWHQDSGYVNFRDPGNSHRPYLTCWCALDDMTRENGTISVMPRLDSCSRT